MLNFFSSQSSIRSEIDNEKWDYRRIILKKNEIKNQLLKYGIKKKNIVILLSSQTATFFASLIAIWECGACAACVSNSITESEMKNILRKTKAQILVGNDSLSKFKIKIKKLNANQNFTENKNFKIHKMLDIDQDALILFTSGTTGEPKGVVHNLRSIYSRINLNGKFIGKNFLKNSLCPLPTHFGHGLIGNCLTSLFFGSNLYLLSNFSANQAINFGKIINENKITFISSVPTMWKLIIKVSESPKKSNLRIHIGSSQVTQSLLYSVSKWSKSKNIYNMYGITETCNWIGGKKFSPKNNKEGLVGKPWGGQYAIKNKNKISLFGSGEILVNTPSVMKYYYANNRETNKVFIESWFKTGDIGKLNKNGELLLTGRIKNEINKAGIKINPEDIDILLDRHPLIIESYTFGIEDEVTGQIACVAAVIKKNNSKNKTDILNFCKKNLIKEKQPDKWFWLQKIPKNERGKINKSDVIKLCIKNNE